MPVTKKVPMRQCVGCKQLKAKKELVRVVKNSEGEISIDLTGKKNGKGAYVCHDIECFKLARKAKSFERSLSCSIPSEIFDAMEAELNADGQ
ncbi:MAG: YlxR family protein [Ruminococcaceae bacterium]|nr:YlxR family protein [Oscillospiraceae bacterium]